MKRSMLLVCVCVLVLQRVTLVFSICNSTHINYCAQPNQLTSYSYTMLRSVEDTYNETYYYKCGFKDLYTCTGIRFRNYTKLVPFTETVYESNTIRGCCDDNATCTGDETYTLRTVAQFGHSANYSYGIIQICLEGLWRYIDYYSYSSVSLCHQMRYQYHLYSTPENGYNSFVKPLNWKSHQNGLVSRLVSYSLDSSVGSYSYLSCESGYYCGDSNECVNGACSVLDSCTCNNGWTGRRCEIATCSSCVYGECTAPNTCQCHSGWMESSCNTAICSQGCDFGVCEFRDVCKCNEGYTGDSCNEIISVFSSHPDEYVDKIAGKEMTLNCSVSNDNGYQIEWYHIFRNGTKLQIPASPPYININYVSNSPQELSILSIREVNLSHAGMYVCLNGFTYSNISHVEIQYPPIFTEHPTTDDDTFFGEDIKLTCTVTGYPVPDIVWIKNGNTISLNNDSLKYNISTLILNETDRTASLYIYDLTEADNGYYSCYGNNSLVSGLEDTSIAHYLDVLYPPNVLHYLIDTTVNISDTLVLNCSITGHPIPNVSWWFTPQGTDDPIQLSILTDNRISMDSFECIYYNSGYDKCLQSSLTIDNITKSDTGTYTCQGSSPVPDITGVFTSSTSAYAFIQVPPIATPIIDESIIEAVVGHDEYVLVNFNITDDIPRVQANNTIWFKTNMTDTYQLHEDADKYRFNYKKTQLNITDLQYTDKGNYTMVAVNEAGSDEASITVSLKVEPLLLNSTGASMIIELLSNVTHVFFNCSADGIPRPSLQWYKDGTLLLNISRYLITYNTHHTDMIRSHYIPDIQLAYNSLKISQIRPTDTGIYECRADNSAGETKIVKYNLTINIEIFKCNDEKNQGICNNGDCKENGISSYYCECHNGYTGVNCDKEVIIEIPASIARVESTISDGAGIITTNRVMPPQIVGGWLSRPLSITCHSIGVPTPRVTWENVNNDKATVGSTLVFEELGISDRGFYKCKVENEVENKLNEEKSEKIQISLSGIFQYKVQLVSVTGTGDLSNSMILISLQRDLSGSYLPDTQIQLLSVEDVAARRQNQQGNRKRKRNTVDTLEVVITVQSPSYSHGSEGMASALRDHVEMRLQQKASQVKPVLDELPIRFDGCSSSISSIPSYESGNKDLDMIISWPESNLGETVSIPCPCGGLDLQSSALVATRMCGGDYIDGAVWEPANDGPCNFTDSIRELCLLALLPPQERVDSLGGFTQDANMFENVEVTVSVAVLLSATSNVTGSGRNSSEAFLKVINNLLQPSPDTLIESQETANTSARMLDALDKVTRGLVVNNTEKELIIPFDSFTVILTQYNNVTNNSSIKVFTNGTDIKGVCTDKDCDIYTPPSAKVTLPPEVFEYTETPRDLVVSAVFVNDALFTRRDKKDQEVSTVILSVTVVKGYNESSSITGLKLPVELVFQMKQALELENASTPVCSFWDPSLDEYYGGWSEEGCHLVSIDNSSVPIEFTCQCDHLTSFSVLMDVSYKEIEPPKTHFDFVLSAYTFIGCVISMVCLVITIISYMANKKLRSTERSVLVINLSLSLIGVYTMFISAIYSVDVPVLCIVVSALLQYFFLVSFFIMATEATELYKKSVKVFVSKEKTLDFFIKVFITCWVLPIIIVGFCLAPDTEYYVTNSLCRAHWIPFYTGTIAPFIIIYIYNWIMFVIVYFNILQQSFHTADRKAASDGDKSLRNSMSDKVTRIKNRLRTAVVLSVIFGLGWGLGLPATQAHDSDILRYVFAVGFNTFTAFQGTVIFIFHCGVNSEDVIKEWKNWFRSAFKKKQSSKNINHSISHPTAINAAQTNLSSLKSTSNNYPPSTSLVLQTSIDKSSNGSTFPLNLKFSEESTPVTLPISTKLSDDFDHN